MYCTRAWLKATEPEVAALNLNTRSHIHVHILESNYDSVDIPAVLLATVKKGVSSVYMGRSY